MKTVSMYVNPFQAERLKKFEDVKSIEELSFVIWDMELENAMKSSRQVYRDCLIHWFKEFKEKVQFTEWNYKTTSDFVYDLYKPYLDNTDSFYRAKLRETVINKLDELLKDNAS
jgi:hypothetical protein